MSPQTTNDSQQQAPTSLPHQVAHHLANSEAVLQHDAHRPGVQRLPDQRGQEGIQAATSSSTSLRGLSDPAGYARAASTSSAPAQGEPLNAVGGMLGEVMSANTIQRFMAAAHDPQQFEQFLGAAPPLDCLCISPAATLRFLNAAILHLSIKSLPGSLHPDSYNP